jgi:tRNA(Leu) C34 or U34 (ribose-2'-O)-methylase TrmL
MSVNDLSVYLYKVGRNLNRAYRTCEAFGISNLYLIDCDAEISGNLFKSKGKVIVEKSDIPPQNNLLALETYHKLPIFDVKLIKVNAIIIGGETLGLPKNIKSEYSATIPMYGQISGLTVEATLAIALYEYIKQTKFTK